MEIMVIDIKKSSVNKFVPIVNIKISLRQAIVTLVSLKKKEKKVKEKEHLKFL